MLFLRLIYDDGAARPDFRKQLSSLPHRPYPFFISLPMTAPTLHHVSCPDAAGGHRMAYWQWGNPASDHVVVCVHGLSRQGRDFDVLAQALCEQSGNKLRVICPDVAGRGESDWLKDPMGYQIPAYAADMLALLAQVQAEAPIVSLDWVGTSMGGIIGMVVCGQPQLPLPVAVRRLVLNDVGPAIEWQAIVRIGQYLGQAGQFSSVQEAADAMWAISSGFGPHTPEQWLALSRPMLKPVPGSAGKLQLHYDPAIAVPFRASTQESTLQGEATLWQLYDNIRADTLLTRGAQSDLLSVPTASAMAQRGPKARLVEFAGVGHAPTFVAADQIRAVAGFLLA
jgi:pimeloyl-ACP methyl ester carboxylesterase